MTREELIEKIKVGITIEKTAVPLYTRHINSQHFLSAFNEEEQSEIQDSLRNLCDESLKHKGILEALLGRIEGEDKDVY